MRKYLYKEETLTQEFMPWFKKARNYLEFFEDTDTSGSDPVDSAGFIGDQLVLIEFKDTVKSGEVWHKGSKGSSIEKKICTVLSHLYEERSSRVTDSVKEWNWHSKPLFMLVANRINDQVQKQLKKLLNTRCDEWLFAYEIMLWKNGSGETLHNTNPTPCTKKDFKRIKFPEMPSTALPRSEKMTVDKCQLIGKSKGLENVTDEMFKHLKSLGAKPKLGASRNLNFSLPSSPSSAIGIWPYDSDNFNGLLITFSSKVLQKHLREQIDRSISLPGTEGPRKGHLGASRYLKTVEEVRTFLDSLGLRT